MAGRAPTVLGLVPADELGVTLVHEHVLMSLLVYWRAPVDNNTDTARLAEAPVGPDTLWWVRENIMDSRDNCAIDDLETAVREVERFRDAGGGCLMEVTSTNIGRNPRGLVEVARRTGLHVVMGTGYYIGASHPPDLAERSVEELADEFCRDLLDGDAGSGVRAGVLGEIGTSEPITPVEERVVRAAATAQRHTGAPIVIHPAPGTGTVDRLVDLLERAGAEPARVVLSHLDERLRDDVQGLVDLAKRGYVLGFDTFGRQAYYASRGVQLPSDADRIRTLVGLIAAGYASSVALAQDICFKSELTRFGGHGYGYVLRHIVPRLRRAGVSQSALDCMLCDTPRRLLAWA